MKLIQSALQLLLFCALIACGDSGKNTLSDGQCLPAGLQNGLIAFYPFSNGSLADASLSSNDLINTSAALPAEDRTGNPGCAYSFINNGSTTSFLTTHQTGFLNNLTNFSISLWYMPLDSVWDGEYQVLISRGNQDRCADRRGEWSVSLYDCRRVLFAHNNSLWANMVTPSSTTHCQDEVDALVGKWHHVVAIKEGNNYRLYFNGVFNGTASGVANCSTATYLAQDIGDLFIGTDFYGKIDDILIYNRTLTAQEVAELYTLAPCCE